MLAATAAGQVVTARLPVGALPSAVAVNPVTNKIYVADYLDSDIAVIDGSNNTSTRIPANAPIAIAVNPLTNKIYAINLGDDTVEVIDGNTSETETIDVGVNPWAIAVNPVTNRVYVTNHDDGTVTVIDGASGSTSDIQTGVNPTAVAINPVTNHIYVANNGDDTVTIIDGATSDTTTVSVGNGPWAIAINPLTDQVYVVNNGSNSVTVIDGATNNTTEVLVGDTPLAIALNPASNKIYVSNFNADTVTVIDGPTNATSTITLTAGSGPNAIAVNPVGNQIYVANTNTDGIAVVDGSTNSVINLPSGSFPYAVVVNPVTNKIYVTGAISNDVTIVDGSPMKFGSAQTGDGPVALDINPTTNQLYVANSKDSTVSVIDGLTGAISAIIPADSLPSAVAVDAVMSRVYVANRNGNDVTVIDGVTNTGFNLAAGTAPAAIAINPVTQEVYVANYGSNDVTVINAGNFGRSFVLAGTEPCALGLNAVTNTIYVANCGGSSITAIDGGTQRATAVSTGANPAAIGVNTATNKIYVANSGSSSVTVVHGSSLATSEIAVGLRPSSIAVNPVTNQVYVANSGSQSVTVIDGTSDVATATVQLGVNPATLAVNPASNKIYVTSGDSPDVMVIDGATNTISNVPGVPNPGALAMNPVTNVIYVLSNQNNTVGAIAEAPRALQGYRATAVHSAENLGGLTPTFTLLATDEDNNPMVPLNVYWQIDTVQSSWNQAAFKTGNSFSAVVPQPLTLGRHVLYSYPVQGDVANPEIDMGTPRMGDISAYLFTVTQQSLPGAVQTITFPPIGIQTYGAAPILLEATASSGLTVKYRVLFGPATVTGNVLMITGSGYVTVEADQGGDSTFAPAPPVLQSFRVNPAALTVTANDASMMYGDALPSFSVSYSGFVNADNESVLTGLPSLTTTATPASPPGTYPIIAAQGSLAAQNYTFLFANGTLTVNGVKAQIASPANGSTFTDMVETFTWSAESAATSYSLWLGRTPGAKDLGACGSLTLSCAVGGLPTDGSAIYATLWGKANDVWTVQDSAAYTAVTLVKAQIVSPGKGSTLKGSTVTFTWSAESGATSYQLWVGSAPGQQDLGYIGTNSLQATVGGLPQDGRQIYVTLYGYSLANWSVQDAATYTSELPAQIIYPPKASKLDGPDVMFRWSPVAGATSYQLWAGTAPNTHDIGYVGTCELQATFSNLPINGTMVYMTLYVYADQMWSLQDTAIYTAASISNAQIVSPVKGSTLTSDMVTFAWSPESGATSYQVWVGTTPRTYDITYGGTSESSIVLAGLPNDGRQVYVTLWGYSGGGWSVQDTAAYTSMTGFGNRR